MSLHARGTLLRLAIGVMIIVMAVAKFVRLKLGWLIDEVRTARQATAQRKPIAPDAHGNSNRVLALVRAEDGPVVEAPNLKTPLPLSRVPARSSKRDLERGIIAIALHHSGKRNLTIHESRKYLKQWAREHPNTEIAVPVSNPIHDAAVAQRELRLAREAVLARGIV